MARTAPVPDIPPIPGMNPGTIIAGGGGGAGGDGSGDGGDGDGNAGANPETAGDNAGGDGQGAGACGSGTPQQCTNCHNSLAAGDPVNVVTGEVFTFAKTDLFLHGFFNLRIDRSYATGHVDRDCGLGWGWTHTLAWELRVHPGSISVRHGDGRVLEFPSVDAVGSYSSRGAWAILRTIDGYVYRGGDEFFHRFAPDPDDATRFRLVEIWFRNRGSVSLHYDRGRLARVVDTAGRQIVFAHTPEGRIASLSVPEPGGRTIVFARYVYGPEGDLAGATDADGHTTRYAYDREHRLVQMSLPGGPTFFFRYDVQGRCVETWGERPGGDPALAPDLPRVLADGRTRAKGVFHAKIEFSPNGYSELVDSVRLQRFFAGPAGKIAKAVDARGGVTTRTFDIHGNETSHTDALGAVHTYEYSPQGYLLRETDPEGRTTSLERDEEGRITKIVDATGGVVVGTRDPYGDVETLRDQRGGVHSYRFSPRGQVTEMVDARGAQTLYTYDAQGNCVVRRMPNGAVYRFTYDYWGRTLSQVDPLGREARWGYSDAGRVIRVTDGSGRSKVRDFDALGNLVAITTPDGARTRFEYGGNQWHCATIFPDGDRWAWEYNREGWIVRARNESGETQELKHGPTGRIVEEKQFTGAIRRYGYDAMDRLLWFDDGKGKTEFVRNKVGQVVAAISPDEVTRKFEYDARGDLAAAREPGVELQWDRDPCGAVVRETLTLGRATYAVESQRDSGGLRTGLRTSLGHSLDIRLDALGDVFEVREGPELALRYARDPLGWPVRRDLCDGGAILDAYDEAHRLRDRWVLKKGTHPEAPGHAEPEWLAPRWQGLHKRFSYSAVDEITTVESDADGTIHYEYDVRKRLLSKAREGAVLEAFEVDAAGNLHERGPDAEPRVHGQGSKLLKRGSTEYLYDDRGFLLEKRRGDFARDRLDRWRYHWGPFDLLESAELPDGRRVSFRYDSFARRVKKLVSRTDAQGQTEVLSEIHYVWDLDTLLHEVRTGAGGDRPSTTTYLFENNEDGIPLAQREGAGGAGDWLYFVGDAIETPEEMVDGSGAPRGRMQRSAFGVAAPNGGGAATALRFTGQYADEETGLYYNRYRYYDPEVGRYISPDPIGIDGGFNLYAYGPNPVGWVDPAGLTHEMTVVSALDKSGLPLTIPKEGQKYQSGCSDCTLPPGATKDGQFPKDLASQAKCHTERKLDHDLGKNGKRLDGANVTVQGTFPPCPNCHRAMQKIAEGPPKMAALKYQWPDPHGNMQSMTYPGDKNGPVPGTTDKAGNAVAGGDAAALAKAYKMQKDPGSPSGYAFDNHSGRVPDPNNPGKTVVDPNSAAGQYKRQADAIDPNRGRK